MDLFINNSINFFIKEIFILFLNLSNILNNDREEQKKQHNEFIDNIISLIFD